MQADDDAALSICVVDSRKHWQKSTGTSQQQWQRNLLIRQWIHELAKLQL